ncbi:hypothetical protein INS49_004420 [Diaporthe citri]|uniref:uncharacterized protein n=1 Tax=Diaporthe citri TaxID=83186 RepID=UPI001C81B0AE|nr:uncharacterized protein INS49_004420 [Diaporthe citri]KAG6354403.1 hypothetical protein INS49_004420 [Diaporthe citri]
MSKSITKKPGDINVRDDVADQKLQRVPSVLEGDIQEVDDAILHAQGHEAVLTRQFNWISALGPAVANTTLATSSPERWKNFAAFIVGWMSVLAWWIVTCSGLSLAAVTLSGLVNYWHPDYVATQWQIYFIYIAVSTLTIMPLIMAPSKIAWTTQATLYLSVTGSWVLGITNAMYAFGATDGVIHISEEMPQPGKRVPQVMIMTMLIGLLTTLPLVIMLMYYMADLEAVTASALPSLEIVSQAFRNKNVTTFLFTWLWLVYMGSLPSQWVTCGRVAWAFARDNGVPFSEYFSDIHPRLGFPLRTTLAAFAFSCIYGLLYLASTTAFNSIVTSAVLFLNITYAIPQGILLCRNREEALPPRYLNLRWFGYVCNIFSCTWIFVLVVFICMPPRLPVEVGSMNYTSVVLVGLVSIVFVLWIARGKSKFRGPNIDWGLLQRANRVVAHR